MSLSAAIQCILHEVEALGEEERNELAGALETAGAKSGTR